MTKRPAPLTVGELQEMNRTATMQTERRLLWEVHRLRKIALQAHELDILLTDERIFNWNVDLVKVARALRVMLENEPVVLEDQEKHDIRKLRKWVRF